MKARCHISADLTDELGLVGLAQSAVATRHRHHLTSDAGCVAAGTRWVIYKYMKSML